MESGQVWRGLRTIAFTQGWQAYFILLAFCDQLVVAYWSMVPNVILRQYGRKIPIID